MALPAKFHVYMYSYCLSLSKDEILKASKEPDKGASCDEIPAIFAQKCNDDKCTRYFFTEYLISLLVQALVRLIGKNP